MKSNISISENRRHTNIKTNFTVWRQFSPKLILLFINFRKLEVTNSIIKKTVLLYLSVVLQLPRQSSSISITFLLENRYHQNFNNSKISQPKSTEIPTRHLTYKIPVTKFCGQKSIKKFNVFLKIQSPAYCLVFYYYF